MRKILILSFLLLSIVYGSSFAYAQQVSNTLASTTDPATITQTAFDNVSSTTESILKNFKFRTDNSLPPEVTLPAIYKKVPIQLDLTPEFPGPNQEVTVKLTSFSTNLQINKIAWYVNGSLKLARTGATSFTFTTGNFGQISNISASVVADNGFITDVSATVVPTSVDMLWQANTYTPPFYKGKALNSHQSPVVIIANPTIVRSGGVAISPESLVYRWEYNDKFVESGLGKNNITITDPLPSVDSLVKVDVTSLDGKIKTQGTIRLSSVDPKVILYEEGPDGVHYEKSLSSKSVNISQSTKITAAPYFFAINNKNSKALSYSWYLNGDKTNNTKSGVTLSFSDKSGQAYIETEALISDKMFQRAKNALSVTFSENPRSNQSIF